MDFNATDIEYKDSYILDVSKWRCGGFEGKKYKKALGDGITCLRNSYGFMCCLGQFAEQKVGSNRIHPEAQQYPADLAGDLNDIYDSNFVQCNNQGNYSNTSLSDSAMEINDDPTTSILEKVIKLTKLLNNHKIKLYITNYEDTFSKFFQKD